MVPSSYQPKKTHKPRTAIRTTEISQSSGPINLVIDETVYKEWEDRMGTAATTASSLDFGQTASTRTLEDGEVEITATIYGQLKTITEASLRRYLKLEDVDGISSLPNTEIFEQLALIGPKKTAWEQFSSNIATAIICLATNRTFNFSKMIFKGMVKNLDSMSKFLMYPRFIQILLNKHQRLLLPHKRTYVAPTLTQKLFSNMRRVFKGYTGVDIPLFSSMLVQGPIQQGEGSTVLVESHHTPITTPSTSQPPLSSPSRLSDKVLALETDLQQTKKVYSTDVIKLIMKVKRLEKIVKSGKARRRAKIVLGVLIAAKVLTDVARVHTYSRRRRTVSTSSGEVSTASRIISIAEETVSTTDKGKAVITESEPEQTASRLKERQEKAGYEAAIKLQEQLDQKESQRIARHAEIALRLQEEIDAAERHRMAKLTQKLQAEEREKYSEVDQTKMLVDLIIQRKRFFAQQKDEAKRNKPMTQAQQRTYMSNNIKNQEGGYSIKQLKSLSFEEVKEIFETTMKRVHSFMPMDSELEVQRLKRAGQEVLEEPSKRQKIGEALGSGEEQSAEKEKEVSEEEL
ncbi:hypothetical protein Tco_0654382 [Tanacetum coccineum]|uniref:Uncharacterized protein n=1 Tax=Tanacetum coccineum TaxID=301880 RepID=A0ABQ4X3F9_9ASTR